MVTIKNHFPGRVRLEVAKLVQYPGIGDWIKQSLVAIQGVKDVRVNEHAKSVVVYYDDQLLDFDII